MKGLSDKDLEDVIVQHDNETHQEIFRRLVAAIISQKFSYLVRAGLECAYVGTGEAFIFLNVPDDLTTVHQRPF
ncbi:MAG: hypothetical protein M1825_000980 [Sarcosagium campestre]|nr:MAG: hypothetical protein M1825_000980 [Sarcosagium campestre]